MLEVLSMRDNVGLLKKFGWERWEASGSRPEAG